MDVLDIRYTGVDDAAGLLSNLATKPFMFRGCYTLTIEGVLQSLKVYDVEQQQAFWTMKGFAAKKAGRGIIWQTSQILWWNQQPIDRHGEDYQDFLDELFAQCYSQNQQFRDALAAVRGIELQHTIGNVDPERTILTVDEFLDRLKVLQSLQQ